MPSVEEQATAVNRLKRAAMSVRIKGRVCAQSRCPLDGIRQYMQVRKLTHSTTAPTARRLPYRWVHHCEYKKRFPLYSHDTIHILRTLRVSKYRPPLLRIRRRQQKNHRLLNYNDNCALALTNSYDDQNSDHGTRREDTKCLSIHHCWRAVISIGVKQVSS